MEWNPKGQCFYCNSQSLNSVHILTVNFSKIHFNTIPRVSEVYLTYIFPVQNGFLTVHSVRYSMILTCNVWWLCRGLPQTRWFSHQDTWELTSWAQVNLQGENANF